MTQVPGRVRQGQIKNLESTGKPDGGTYLSRNGERPLEWVCHQEVRCNQPILEVECKERV